MKSPSLLKAAILTLALAACAPQAWSDEPAHAVPAFAETALAPTGAPLQTAVLSGGCFWGMEGVFEHVKGVRSVVSGYSGGQAATAHYDIVSTGTTGHAETVQVTFDPHQVSYGQILQIYFSVATDPTELNRQGPDDGAQYRGEIWAANADQERIAHAYIAQLTAAHAYSHPIVTRVDPLVHFYPAEDYHQNYLSLHPDQGYIVYNDLPKVANLQRLFSAMYVAQRAP